MKNHQNHFNNTSS